VSSYNLFSIGEIIAIVLILALGTIITLSYGCSCRTIYQVDYQLYGDFQPEEGWVECR